MAFIDQNTLDTFNTLGDVLQWARVTGDPGDVSTLRGAFLQAAGATEDLPPRILGVVDDQTFERVAGAVKMISGNADAPVETLPTLAQMGSLSSVGHACRLKAGLLASLPAAAAPLVHAAPAASTGGVAVPPCKVKLSLCVRQADETEVPLISEGLISAGHARWERLFGSGKRPKPDQEATMAQLSGLHYLLESGQVPTVDFAVWGPHGSRIERKLRLSGSVFAPDGSLRTIEIAGPPTIGIWLASWEVFTTAAVILNIFDLGALIDYREHIVRLHTRYGPQVWLLLYQTDTRFRSEHMLRVKRKLADDHETAVSAGRTTPFEKDRPWNLALIEGTADPTWWFNEFTEPAMMILARTANIQSLVSDEAPVASSGDPGVVDSAESAFHHKGDAGRQLPPPPRTTVRKQLKKQQDMSRISEGRYTYNRAGNKLCEAFQTGACGNAIHGNYCPKDRSSVHQCSRCLSQTHGGAQCTSSNAPKQRPPTRGWGKGKGKGSKSQY